LFSWNEAFVSIPYPVHVVSSPMPKFYSIENQFIEMYKTRFSCSEADRKCSETDTTIPGLINISAPDDVLTKITLPHLFLSEQSIFNADNL
jgi:hypothetical protein